MVWYELSGAWCTLAVQCLLWCGIARLIDYVTLLSGSQQKDVSITKSMFVGLSLPNISFSKHSGPRCLPHPVCHAS